MVCYLGNTFCYAIQGEMKNESKPAPPDELHRPDLPPFKSMLILILLSVL